MVPSCFSVFLEQVQKVDYSGDEVQVTTTDGTGYTAQKVSARISLGVLGAWRLRERCLFYQEVAFGNLPGALFDF